MGLYNKDDEVAYLRPVYKKTDRDDLFIFYDSKLYFIMVITVYSLLYLSLQVISIGILVMI